MDVRFSRRGFVQLSGGAGLAAAVKGIETVKEYVYPDRGARCFPCVQIDVFTSRRLEGNPLAVFTDARGLADAEMQALARETNLQETTFVFPRSSGIEREKGVKVRIFAPTDEIPFGGHPTLGTAMVLRNLRLQSPGSEATNRPDLVEICLDLQVGKVPVKFSDASNQTFGEMHQVDPKFGQTHDRNTVAAVLDLSPADISDDAPIQTLSTGLPFVIVPIKKLSTLQRLTVAPRKAYDYLRAQNLPKVADYYYVTRDTGDPSIGLRARAIYPEGEDPATGSAAGCTAAWMVRHGIAEPEKQVHILQGVEASRPSHIFVRASKTTDKVDNVRVGGHAVPIMEGAFFL